MMIGPVREQLYGHVMNKYGSVDKVSHYETYEIKTTDGIKVLDEGLVVNESFQFIRPDGTTVPKADSRNQSRIMSWKQRRMKRRETSSCFVKVMSMIS